MSDTSAIAFGRYLRELRERKRLSLCRVSALTERSSEPIDKGTLSRLERGLQVPSIFKLGPLCRVYGVTAEVLIERMELDREVDRLGGAATEGKSYRDLQRLGHAALTRQGRKWEAYAHFRDATALAGAEERVPAWSNLATAIRSLGRNALALHELREIEASTPEVGRRALLHERISNCYRCLANLPLAEQYADSAIALAAQAGDPRLCAYAQAARAIVAIDQEQWSVAVDYLERALEAHRENPSEDRLVISGPAFEAQTLLMLADCAIHLTAIARARRLALAAKRISEEHELALGLAYSELLLGQLDDRQGLRDQAYQRWRKGAALALRLDNQRLAFTMEMEMFRQALSKGDPARARASRRRLEQLAPWVPAHIPALRDYKRLTEATVPTSNRTPRKGGSHARAAKLSGARVSARTAHGPSHRRHHSSDEGA